MNYPDNIKNLINSLKKLPGVGEKTAERMALSIIKMDNSIIDDFSNSIKCVKNIKYCDRCNFFSTDNLCDICKDDSRNKDIICVVDDPKTIIQFEKMGTYKGRYYILNNLISPLDHIGPIDLNLDKLFGQVEKEDIKEVIIAVKPSLEGETTSLYISKKLKEINVFVSKIANGIPLGADMEYIDSLTLELALENRKKIS